MRVVVLANEQLKLELLEQGVHQTLELTWIQEVDEFAHYPAADAYVDLLFQPHEQRIQLLEKLPAKPIIISSVIKAGIFLPSHFVRINGWITFLRRAMVEAYCPDKATCNLTEKIFSAFNKKVVWTPDIAGFLSARVIAMIINEAYFTLAEDVSTKQAIDTAMKLGTNYPYGPFEWSKKIGLKNIVGLLQELSRKQSRYGPAPLLKKEAT